MVAYQTQEQYELKQVALTLYGYLTENPDSNKSDKAPNEYNTSYDSSPQSLVESIIKI